jgi:two-component system sensor histidine kinase BaeS
MRRLFYILLFSILASLVLSLLVMIATFRIGYTRSSNVWSTEKSRMIEQEVVELLKEVLIETEIHGQPIAMKLDPLVPPGVTLIVYDEKKQVIYSHMRGRSPMGRMRHHESPDSMKVEPVRVRGRTVGYYALGAFGFGADRATSRFLESMRKTVFLSLASAVAIALFLSLFVSRRLSRTARAVSDGINEMAQGNLRMRISQKGAQEISRIAESANELASKLEREENIRQQWAADIAHDLKTPLSALRSQLEAMSDGVLEITSERIEKNLTELGRIEALVNDLGELTRLESPRMRIEPKSVDAATFFGELQERFSRQFEEKGITVEWDANTDSFFGDENLMGRAVSNVIDNAIRHTPKGGKISVCVRREEASYVFSVFNSGNTIPKDEIGKVFDRLYRGEHARSTPGTGLGLTIAQKIAQLHGGTSRIESIEGKGTTVEICIEG